MLSKIILIASFAMGFYLYYDLVGALLFSTMVLALEWMIGK